MTDIRLLVLDVDGTIAGESNSVSPVVLETLRQVQAKGIKVAIATGRMYGSARRFQQCLQTTEPITAYNGAWIQHPGAAAPLRHRPVPPERIAELLDFAQQPEWRSHLEVHLYADDQLYVSEVTPHTEDYVGRTGIPANAVGDLKTLLDRDLTKMLLLAPEPATIAEISPQLRDRYRPHDLHITQSTPIFLEFTQAATNKGSAIAHLAQEHYQIPLAQVMAIGDNFNDLEMLQAVGFGVAMGNAPDAVQAEADWITKTVDEDGVAVAVEQFLLN